MAPATTERSSDSLKMELSRRCPTMTLTRKRWQSRWAVEYQCTCSGRQRDITVTTAADTPEEALRIIFRHMLGRNYHKR